jgi:gamma-aminobutyric acid type B receptor
MAMSCVFSLSLLLTSGWTVGLVGAQSSSNDLNFAMLTGGSQFFEPVKLGWEKKCRRLGVNCQYILPECPGIDQMRDLIKQNVDGIAITPCNPDEMRPIVAEATDAGIPVITFDGDIPNSTRAAYVGTDNIFLGRTMAKLLKQLRPEGGTFNIVTAPGKVNLEQRSEGFRETIMKNNGREDRAHWYEVGRNLTYEYEDDPMGQMENAALLNPTALIIMYQSPMRHPNWTDLVDTNRHRNITFVGSDGSDYQLTYLAERYVDGLVGQLPYEFGSRSAEVLYDLAAKGAVEKDVFATNLVAYNLIPLELPPLDVDQNLLGNFKYTGLICFGLVALSALACAAWTLHHRDCMIVRAAQPFFLMMTAGGVLLMSSTLVPLSFDDQGDPNTMSTTRSVGICMSIPWLAFTGFTVTFSALFSKTWRVNQFFHSSSAFGRVKVSERDVLAPFAVLLACNFVVLICWTVLDPLTYKRQFEEGTDYWNREIASNGSCRSDHVAAYMASLGLSKFPELPALVPYRPSITYSPNHFPNLLRSQFQCSCHCLLASLKG